MDFASARIHRGRSLARNASESAWHQTSVEWARPRTHTGTHDTVRRTHAHTHAVCRLRGDTLGASQINGKNLCTPKKCTRFRETTARVHPGDRRRFKCILCEYAQHPLSAPPFSVFAFKIIHARAFAVRKCCCVREHSITGRISFSGEFI